MVRLLLVLSVVALVSGVQISYEDKPVDPNFNFLLGANAKTSDEARFQEKAPTVSVQVTSPTHTVTQTLSEQAQELENSMPDVPDPDMDGTELPTDMAPPMAQSGGAPSAPSEPADEFEEPINEINRLLMRKVKQVEEETEWVEKMKAVILEYSKKTRNVDANVHTLKKEVEELYRKKKQIENLRLQKK